MIKAIAMAYELEGCGAGNEAAEMRRLSAIEQAATALIKCKDCQDADVAAQGLADALGIELPIYPQIDSQAVSPMAKTAPEVIWLQVSDSPHESALPFPENHADVTWCSESVMPSEVQYVRADLAAGPCGEPVAPSWVYLGSGRNEWDSAGEYADEGNLQVGDEFTLGTYYHHKAKFKVKSIDKNERCVVEQIEGQLYSALVLPPTGANQSAKQAGDPDRPSAVELPQASSEEPEPVAWRVYCPTWGGDGYGIWNSYKKDDRELTYYLGRPDCRIEYAMPDLTPTDHFPGAEKTTVGNQVDDIDVVELNRPTAIELQAAEVGIPVPVTELINPA